MSPLLAMQLGLALAALAFARRAPSCPPGDEPIVDYHGPSCLHHPSGDAPSSDFDRGAAAAELGAIAVRGCRATAGPSGEGTAKVTFEPDGRVSAVVISPPFDGTPVGVCLRARFAKVRTRAYRTGGPVTVTKHFLLR